MQRTNSFNDKLERCVRKVFLSSDDDYKYCMGNYAFAVSKSMHMTSRLQDQVLDCCAARMLNFKCFRTLLHSKCGISKEEVMENDDEHFNLWNNLRIPTRHGKCGEKQQSLRYCNLDDDSENEINSTAKIRAEDSQADSSNSILTQAQYKAQLYNQSMISIPTIISLPKTNETSKLFNLLKNYQLIVQLVKKDSNNIN